MLDIKKTIFLVASFLGFLPSLIGVAQCQTFSEPERAQSVSTSANSSLSQEREKDPNSKKEPRFDVKKVVLVGATLFSPERLSAEIVEINSGSHSFGDLQLAAQRVTSIYRESGYPMARAYLPPQKMEDGVITIAVLEGRLSEIQLQNTSTLSDERIRAYFSQLPVGAALHKPTMDRALLLLGDVPGVGSVESRLAAGVNTGETILVVDVKPASSWSGKLEADNFGSRYSGAYRAGASIEGRGVLGYGDKFSANFLLSDEKMLYGRAHIQLPIGGHGLTGGVGINHSQYFLGDIYKTLDAVGQSDTLEATMQYPLRRSTSSNIHFQAAVEQKKLRDEVRVTNTQTDKRATQASVSLLSDWRDTFGSLRAGSYASLTLASGRLGIDSADVEAIDRVAAKTAGNFNKVSFSFNRQQGLTSKLSLAFGLRGQWANKNLDSSEKFSLGGANGVRAYPVGEASGDRGWLGNVDLQYQVLPWLNASVFYDAGKVQVNSLPFLTTANDKQLSGYGIGLSGNIDAFDWRFSWARRGGVAATAEPDKTQRLWLQGSWRF